MSCPLYAILLDGGFLTKKLYTKLGRHATADDIVEECKRLQQLEAVRDYDLLRIYYYDAPPSSDAVTKPVSRARLNLGTSERFRLSQSLYDQLVLKPSFALRMGETVLSPDRWRIKPRIAKELVKGARALKDDDFQSDFVPAFKFVRREGVKVILDPMGHNVRIELRAHADIVITDGVPPAPKPDDDQISN